MSRKMASRESDHERDFETEFKELSCESGVRSRDLDHETQNQETQVKR
jgi:hypothetical protein